MLDAWLKWKQVIPIFNFMRLRELPAVEVYGWNLGKAKWIYVDQQATFQSCERTHPRLPMKRWLQEGESWFKGIYFVLSKINTCFLRICSSEYLRRVSRTMSDRLHLNTSFLHPAVMHCGVLAIPSTTALRVNKYAFKRVNELEQSGPLSPHVCGATIMDSLEPWTVYRHDSHVSARWAYPYARR